MKSYFISLPFILILLSACTSAPVDSRAISETEDTFIAAIDKDSYRVGSGDRIQIKVFEQDELSLEVTLDESGVLSYSYLHEITLGGLTTGEIESLITEGLEGDYLTNPSVQVSVMEYRPFFIDGEVSNSGGYPYQPGLNVRKAIALAGGFSERASKSGIYVIRATDKSQTKIIVSLNAAIYPGDIITIEEGFF